MLILGLLLIAAGALVILTAVFSSEGTAAMLGNDLTALTIFLLGVGAGVAIMWGLWILKYGTARSHPAAPRAQAARGALGEARPRRDGAGGGRRARRRTRLSGRSGLLTQDRRVPRRWGRRPGRASAAR